MKILNIGSCNVDVVYSVSHIVLPGETLATNGVELFPGGKGLNQSIAVAKAGANIYHAGIIGNDGKMLIDTLESNGVKTDYLKVDELEKSGSAIIQLSERGENAILLYQGTNGKISKEFVISVLDEFNEGDVLLLQNEINDVEFVIEKAYEKGIKTLFNPAPFDEKLKNIDYGKIAYLILNEIEAQGLAGKETPEENMFAILRKNPTLKVVLTLGSKGCIYTDNGDVCYYPAYEVDVVDTTAAGDTFIGYFIAEICRGKTHFESIRTATLASALAVSKKGASVSIPHRSEVEKATFVMKVKGESRSQHLKQKIDAIINAKLKDVKLSEIASALGYSQTYVSEFIKKIYGVSFSKVLQERRCEEAMKLLLETDLSIGEIIFKVGYENESFFRSVFKEKYGCSPREYRKLTDQQKRKEK